jgi:adenine-specific DNA-methyltransferase
MSKRRIVVPVSSGKIYQFSLPFYTRRCGVKGLAERFCEEATTIAIRREEQCDTRNPKRDTKAVARQGNAQIPVRIVYSRDSMSTPMPNRVKDYPELRYMGSKHRLLPWIHSVLQTLDFETAAEPFVGSGCVAYLLKSMGRRVIASDFLNFPVTVSKATVENSYYHLDSPTLEKILAPVKNGPDFIEQTFTGLFYTREDLRFLDRISHNIETLDNEHQQALARAALIRSCLKKQPRGVFTVSGLRYDDGRRDLKLSIEEHFLEQVEAFNQIVFDNGRQHMVRRADVFELKPCGIDLVYLDPPYVPRSDDNCYIKRYHFLEGLSCYWRGLDIMKETKVRKIPKRFTPFSYRQHDVDVGREETEHALLPEATPEGADRIGMGRRFVRALLGGLIGEQHEGANDLVAPWGPSHKAQLQLCKLCGQFHRRPCHPRCSRGAYVAHRTKAVMQDEAMVGAARGARLSRRSASVRTGVKDVRTRAVEEAVCDAVFRYQLQQPLADAPRPLHYYLAWQGRDPDAACLGRLRAFASDVQPLSHCRVSTRDGVIDRISGACGVIVQVTRLTWVHAAAVDVIGGYYLTHRQAAGLRYHVEYDGRHWAVTAVHLLWRA